MSNGNIISTFQNDTSICIELDHKHELHKVGEVLGVSLHRRNWGEISFQAYKLALEFRTLISSNEELTI
jgi:hypothetical protein